MIAAAEDLPTWNIPALQEELPQHVLTGSMRYSDFAKLGHGGKAEVFRCKDVTLDREVAYKVLHQSLMNASIEQQMLAREARIMASFAHPSIPVVHDLGRDMHGRPYFTMTLVEGRTLYEILSSPSQPDCDFQQPTREERIGYVLQICDALAEVHHSGVVHGDIKPENFIVGDDGVIRLVDWGLARITTEPEESEDRLESHWGRQGSPLYMSPEHVAGQPFLQPPSDIYALGVILYECLTSELPLHGETAQETLQLVAEQEPDPPSLVVPNQDISQRLDETCLRALAKSPDERFQSANEFREALRECYLDELINYERADF